jgi:type II secretory pathway pseudopilin PulG
MTTTAGALIALLLIGLIISMFGASQESDQQRSCKIDTRTLRTAEEAYAAGAARYGTMDQLVRTGFLSEPSMLHTVVPTPDGSAFAVTILSSRCGTIGHTAGQTASDF